MKIRQGFVSNSSSSSFVVALSKDQDTSPDAIKKLLFGDRTFMMYYDHTISTEYAAEQIARDLKDQHPNNAEAIDSALSGWISGAPDMDEFLTKKDAKGIERYDWDAYERASHEFRKKYLENFTKNLPEGMNLYVFEYSDNDGSFGCALEHGGTFDAVPHLCVSHH